MTRLLPRVGCLTAATLATWLLTTATAPAAPPSASPVELFNGRSLDGWVVTGCEADVQPATDDQPAAILIKAGNGLVRTEQQYADFEFQYEWKALNDDFWDSGVYFRFTEVPPGRPWPKKYQVNLLKGMEGDVIGLGAKVPEGMNKTGQWNCYKLTVVGSKARLEVNGKPAWEADGVEVPRGWIALQAEVPRGGQFLFRNITITELNQD